MPNIAIKINNVDKTADVNWQSFDLESVLTKEVDVLKFLIKNYGSKTYRPALNDEVVVLDTDGTTRIFGGIVVETEDTIEAQVRYYSVRCKDFSQLLDRRVAVKVYTNMAVNAIVADLMSVYAPTFTTVGCTSTALVRKVVFNYEPLSRCLKRLADTLGDHDWYVDYYKDVHFFQNSTEFAPFSLIEPAQPYPADGGNFIWNSLNINRNIHQLRNKIFVRGSDFEDLTDKGETTEADGEKVLYRLGYNYRAVVIKKGVAGSAVDGDGIPTGGGWTTLSVGIEGVDNPVSFDVLWNKNSRHIRFRENNKPIAGDLINGTGKRVFPVIAEVTDNTSLTAYGAYEFAILDKSIKSKEAATQRALAELKKYGKKITDASFRTYKSGLKTGQEILVSIPSLGLNEPVTITRIRTKMRTPDTGTPQFEYSVQCVGSENVTMIDLLSKFQSGDPLQNITIGEDEVLDRIQTFFEEINLAEVWNVNSPADESFTETIIYNTNPCGDRVNPWGLNNDQIWVAGSYFMTDCSDKKREPFTDAGVYVQI